MLWSFGRYAIEYECFARRFQLVFAVCGTVREERWDEEEEETSTGVCLYMVWFRIPRGGGCVIFRLPNLK